MQDHCDAVAIGDPDGDLDGDPPGDDADAAACRAALYRCKDYEDMDECAGDSACSVVDKCSAFDAMGACDELCSAVLLSTVDAPGDVGDSDLLADNWLFEFGENYLGDDWLSCGEVRLLLR